MLKDFKIPEDKLTEIQKALNDSHEDKITFYEAKRKELIAKRKRLSNRKQTMYDLLASPTSALLRRNITRITNVMIRIKGYSASRRTVRRGRQAILYYHWLSVGNLSTRRKNI